MKNKNIFLLLVSIGLIISGCAARQGVVKNVGNYSQSLQDSNISITSFHIAHQSSLGQATGLLGFMADNAGGAEVNPEAFTAIQTKLQDSNLFKYQHNTFEKTWDKFSKDNTNKAIEEGKLHGAIDININLVLKSTGLTSSKIIGYGHWKIFGVDGEEKIYIRTPVEDDEIFSGINPSTKDPEHMKKVMRIIEKSTNNFLSYLNGGHRERFIM